MKYVPTLLCLILFTFQGCHSKQAKPHPNTQQVEVTSTPDALPSKKNNIDTEEFNEEFDEEFGEEFNEKQITDIIDPLSGYNRFMTSFNDTFMIYVLDPISTTYNYLIPQPLRIGVSNFIRNLHFPIRFANNLLQLKFQNSSDELERFLVNSTVGLGGLMDPAKNYMQIPAHKEDFGQTLGHYGIGSGFHIVLPFLGPSNVRDLIGITADGYLSPLVNARDVVNYKIPDNFSQSAGIVAFYLINDKSLHLGEYESIKKDAIDLYPFLRDIYEQKRTSDIAE